jgi:hypothetical protein
VTVFAELEALVDRFEEIAQKYGLEKIKPKFSLKPPDGSAAC